MASAFEHFCIFNDIILMPLQRSYKFIKEKCVKEKQIFQKFEKE